MANYSCKKFSPTSHTLIRIHPLQRNRQTNDNHDNSSTTAKVRSAKNRCCRESCYWKSKKMHRC